jgi:hypothetical protein
MTEVCIPISISVPIRSFVTGAAISAGSIFGMSDLLAVKISRPVIYRQDREPSPQTAVSLATLSCREEEAMSTNLPTAIIGENEAKAQQYIAEIDKLWDHVMSDEEVTYFRNARTAEFVPLTADQTHILPTRKK